MRVLAICLATTGAIGAAVDPCVQLCNHDGPRVCFKGSWNKGGTCQHYVFRGPPAGNDYCYHTAETAANCPSGTPVKVSDVPRLIAGGRPQVQPTTTTSAPVVRRVAATTTTSAPVFRKAATTTSTLAPIVQRLATTTVAPAARDAPMAGRLERRLSSLRLRVTGGEVEDQYAPFLRRSVTVDRDNAFTQSLDFLMGNPGDLRVPFNHGLFKIKDEPFYNRAAMTEYIDAATKELFHPEFRVFERTTEEPHYYALRLRNGRSCNGEDQRILIATGRFLAMTLMANRAIGVSMPVWFFSELLGTQVTLEDIKEDEPAYYRSLSYVLSASEADLEDLVIEIYGVEHVVTLENRVDLVNRKINSLTGRDYRYDLVQRGFNEVIPIEIAKHYLTAVELKNLFIGATTINPDELVDSILWLGTSDQETTWMRNLLKSFTQEELHGFLKFATNLPRVPFGGISTITPRINIARSFETPDKFPTAYHCHNTMTLPRYSNEAQFRQRFTLAITGSNWGLK